ncbi:hypothetical protein BJ165DRAFT_243640 [Panaeolus papilionaceus]|nr:hypothetical protein BJ165DRAFT_243640 [Panaeolus papilionaceus]
MATAATRLPTPDWPSSNSTAATSSTNFSTSPSSITMDSSSASPSSSPNPRVRSNENQQQQQQQNLPMKQQHVLQQQSQSQQQQYPSYPAIQQQPQGSWTPSISAPPFYPSFFQNQQPASPSSQHTQSSQQQSQSSSPTSSPYIDPNVAAAMQNAQLAQWAYQQMMFNAQQQMGGLGGPMGVPHMGVPGVGIGSPMPVGFSQIPNQHQQRGIHNPADYFAAVAAQNQLFNPFPSGTPPPPAHRSVSGGDGSPGSVNGSNPAGTGQQYQGFHPYRRPNRQQQNQGGGSQTSSPTAELPDWRAHQLQLQQMQLAAAASGGVFHPPYARPDASGSSSSLNSGGSGRQRTNSNQSSSSHRGAPTSNSGHGSSPRSSPAPQNASSSSSGGGSPNSRPSLGPHHRNTSTGSNVSASAGGLRPSPSSTTTATTSGSVVVSPASGTSVVSSSSSSGTSGSGASSPGAPLPRLTRPSPLSQGTFTASGIAEKRMSRDDIDLGGSAPLVEASSHGAGRSGGGGGGLKGRLRRALSFNVLKEEEEAEAELAKKKEKEKEKAKDEEEEEIDDDESIKASVVNGKMKANAKLVAPPLKMTQSLPGTRVPGRQGTLNSPGTDHDDAASTAPTLQSTAGTAAPKKKGRAASLFNSRLNASTDNISLSSTVSSASVMIRKLGAMGKLARRNSLAGITSLFKDKKDKEGKEKKDGKDGKSKKEKSAKGNASEASVSHVTAELDRMGVGEGDGMHGLSPAAKLARQHTLKSNAEAAARAKREKEAKDAREKEEKEGQGGANGVNGVNGGPAGVPTWDKNTATRSATSPVKAHATQGAGVRINEDGTRTLIEEDDDESDDGHSRGQRGPGSSVGHGTYDHHADGWDEDEDWDIDEEEEEEDVTIRVGNAAATGQDGRGWTEGRSSGESDASTSTAGATGYASGSGYYAGQPLRDEPEMEPWAVDVRRSVERTRKPTKGILKRAETYDQTRYLQDQTNLTRARSNSYTSPASQNELGPLARIPSPDPDHIDGLHRHGSHSSGHHSSTTTTFLDTIPSLPPLSFDSSSSLDTSFGTPTKDLPATPGDSTTSQQNHRASAIFQHPNFNSSAPALSTMGGSGSGSTAPTLTHRSATTPSKRLMFATNLSVYDTFSASVYDRRSEPATWSRLTPALAQRIKEELNSYKMEEMEVHASSRVHTQFFV